MNYPYYVIEHRSRGVYSTGNMVWSPKTRQHEYKPRFRWSVSRSGGWITYDESTAIQQLAKVQAAVAECYLLKMTGDLSSMNSAVLIWRNNRWEPYS